MFMDFSKSRSVLCAAFMASTLIACSGDNNNKPKVTEPEYLPIANPEMSLPPDVGEINLLAENFDLADVGYQQSEYFLEGTASAFTNLSELADDGAWSVEPGEEATYKTRITRLTKTPHILKSFRNAQHVATL